MRALLCSALLLVAGLANASETAGGVTWIRSEPDAFARAKSEHKFVILYLEAVWCHWCHVMDQKTYGNPDVRKALDAHYVPLRIDQDSRPDLANRYRPWGWPATIVFSENGDEIVKRQGFIEPERMAKLLDAIVKDPSPEELAEEESTAPATSEGLAEKVRAELKRRHHDNYDEKEGGLDTAHKYVERDSVEYALLLADEGDKSEAARVKQTLTAGEGLLDPVWGGVYQYSTNNDWKHQHFEKLAMVQADYLSLYSRAYAQTGEQRYLKYAQGVRKFLADFLSSTDGGYYVSQDADLKPGEHSADFFALDDKKRRARGIPRVDKHLYARESGAIAEAQAAYYEATGDAEALAQAEKAVAWAIAQRALPGGGFKHDASDAGGPYLGDALYMGRAFVQLYRVTGKRDYLARAEAAAKYIDANFRAKAGYASGAKGNSPIAPIAQIDENISLARFANLLARYTGNEDEKKIAERALAWLAMESVGLARLTESGILLVDRELAGDPVHLTVIGPKDDAQTATLYQAALRVPGSYKRLDWWDRAEGPLPNPDVQYPPLKKPAAFVCTNRRCSVPLYKPEDIAAFLKDSRESPGS